MEVENERRFLVRQLPDFDAETPLEIAQYYVLPDSSMRIRSTNGTKFELTKKVSIDPAVPGLAQEYNAPLDAQEYTGLKSIADRGLEKTRYERTLGEGVIAHIDIYRGNLDGLVKVEVEFHSQDARVAFTPPDWFGREVTDEAWASNSRLAGKRYKDIERFITTGPDAA